MHISFTVTSFAQKLLVILCISSWSYFQQLCKGNHYSYFIKCVLRSYKHDWKEFLWALVLKSSMLSTYKTYFIFCSPKLAHERGFLFLKKSQILSFHLMNFIWEHPILKGLATDFIKPLYLSRGEKPQFNYEVSFNYFTYPRWYSW